MFARIVLVFVLLGGWVIFGVPPAFAGGAPTTVAWQGKKPGGVGGVAKNTAAIQGKPIQRRH